MAEYKLSYTGSEIDAKLSQIDNLATKGEISELSEVIESHRTPTVSSADVGKFLRVSTSGKWVAESVLNVEEVAI